MKLTGRVVGVALFVAAPQAQDDDLAPGAIFVSSRDYATRSVDAWSAEFERSEFTAHDALWSVVRHGDSPETRARLLDWADRTKDASRRVEIDAVLHHWGVEHLCAQDFDTRYEDALFPDIEDSAETDDELLAALDHMDASVCLPAAVRLARRERTIDVALRKIVRELFTRTQGQWADSASLVAQAGTLVDAGGESDDEIAPWARALRHAQGFAGSAADRAVGRLLVAPESDDALRLFLLRRVGFSPSADASEVARALVPCIDRDDEIGGVARWILSSVALPRLAWSVSVLRHEDLHDERATNPDALGDVGDDVGIALGRFVRSAAAAGTLSPERLVVLAPLIASSSSIAEAMTSVLEDLVREDSALSTAALFVGTHAGLETPAIRDAVLAWWKACDGRSSALAWAPCLREPSEEVRAEIRAAYRRSSPATNRAFLPVFLGNRMSDADEEPALREIAERMTSSIAIDEREAWATFYDAGLGGTFDELSFVPHRTNVLRLAVSLRTARRRGDEEGAANLTRALLDGVRSWLAPAGASSFSELDAVAFRVLADLDVGDPGFDRACVAYLVRRNGSERKPYADFVRRYLVTRRLSLELSPFVFRETNFFASDPRDLDLLAAQGELALETISRWPRLTPTDSLYGPRIPIQDYERRLRVTRLTPRQLDDLALAARWAVAADRARIFNVVAGHRLDAKGIREAIDAAKSDLDERVRIAAQEASRALGP